jgi:hypothetical protein
MRLAVRRQLLHSGGRESTDALQTAKQMHKPQVYFGAIDRQMEHFVDREAFRRALVYGVLFQGDLVIPDIFLYISNQLAEMVMTDEFGPLFLRSCLRNGAIIPAFRKDPHGSFRDSLQQINSQGIQGVLSQASEIADTLQAMVRGKRLQYLLWPNTPLSVGYKATLERAFLSQSLPSGCSSLEQFWESTEKIRLEVIGGTPPDQLGGLRRGDVYNSLASYLHSSSNVVQDIRMIWDDLEDEHLASTAQRLLKWVNYCYYFNQGTMFALDPSLAALDNLDSEFARHLAQLQGGASGAPVFVNQFRLPSTDALLTVDPAYVFEVRDSEVGADYFDALAAWKDSPCPATAEVLLNSLQCYTSRLRGLYLERGRSVFHWDCSLRALIPGGPGWRGVVRETVAEIGNSYASSVVPGIGLASIVGKVAAVSYEWLPAWAHDALDPLLGVGNVRFDVEEQMTRIGEARQMNLKTDASFESPLPPPTL